MKEHTPLRIRSLLFRAVVRGIDGLIADDEIASYLTPNAVVDGGGPRAALAVDGELTELAWPLRFELVPGCVLVVGPAP